MMPPEAHYQCAMIAIDELRLHALNLTCNDSIRHLQQYQSELARCSDLDALIYRLKNEHDWHSIQIIGENGELLYADEAPDAS